MARETEPHKLAFTIPIFEPLPPQYFVRAVADSWLGAEAWLELSFQGLILPERMPPHTGGRGGGEGRGGEGRGKVMVEGGVVFAWPA